jgi:hypothetical protein
VRGDACFQVTRCTLAQSGARCHAARAHMGYSAIAMPLMALSYAMQVSIAFLFRLFPSRMRMNESKERVRAHASVS